MPVPRHIFAIEVAGLGSMEPHQPSPRCAGPVVNALKTGKSHLAGPGRSLSVVAEKLVSQAE